MKFNKWTLGLAAVGVVSLTSAARADEKMSSVQTALSNTTISGYVSASMNWQIDPTSNQDSPANSIPFQSSKKDGFNLDVVKLSISKPEDESPWASGYNVDLYFGPDAVGYNPSPGASYNGQSADSCIKQAYVTLRTPVGNGIDWKIGVFDTIIGYEVTDAGSNPNYTRSIGYAVEPTEHTGVLATYKINDEWSVSAGVANTLSAGINTRAGSNHNYNQGYDYYNQTAPWHKTIMAAVTYVAPSSWGWAAGSSIYVGAVYGFGGTYDGDNVDNGYQLNLYAGATLNTPWKQLTAGVAFDYVHNLGGGEVYNYTYSTNSFDHSWSYTDEAVVGLYATWKQSDKLSFNGRAEWAETRYYDNGSYNYTGTSPYYEGTFPGDFGQFSDGGTLDQYELTATVEYDLWANVMSRVEARWDHVQSAGYYGSASSVGLYANVIYKF
jgi:hypothetical protein